MSQHSCDLCHSPLTVIPIEIFTYILDFVLISRAPVNLEDFLDSGRVLQYIRGSPHPEDWDIEDPQVLGRLRMHLDIIYSDLRLKTMHELKAALFEEPVDWAKDWTWNSCEKLYKDRTYEEIHDLREGSSLRQWRKYYDAHNKAEDGNLDSKDLLQLKDRLLAPYTDKGDLWVKVYLMVIARHLTRQEYYPGGLGPQALPISPTPKQVFSKLLDESQEEHYLDWLAVNSTCRNFREWGKKAFFSTKVFAITPRLLDILVQKTPRNISAADRVTAMARIRYVVAPLLSGTLFTHVLNLPRYHQLLAIRSLTIQIRLIQSRDYCTSNLSLAESSRDQLPGQFLRLLRDVGLRVDELDLTIEYHGNDLDRRLQKARLAVDIYPCLGNLAAHGDCKERLQIIWAAQPY